MISVIHSVRKEMKSGQLKRIWGRHFSFTVVALVFTSLLFWYWESNPLVISLLSAEEQFAMHTPDLFVDDFTDSAILVNPKERLPHEVLHSQVSKSNDVKTATHTDNVKDGAADVVSLDDKDENKDMSSFFENQDCNYANGKWVADSRRPLYSGLGCKQWLSDMWACRLTQRTDFSYEGYRWQPNSCQMKDFKAVEFLKRMQNKTVALIGDSLGRQQFQSLMCMTTEGEEKPEIKNLGWKYGLVKPKGAVRPDGWAYRFPDTNTTILYYWSASLCGIEPINATDPGTEFAMHLDKPPSFLVQFLPTFDVVILNTGHHWNRGKINANRWVMYANGEPVKDRKLAEIGNAKNHAIHSIVKWMDFQIARRPDLKVFFRTISPRHFLNGDWNTGGSCDNVTPLSKGSEVLRNYSSDSVVESAVKGTKVKILDITAISELRDEGHISRYSIKASSGINDCLHWCLPGIPDTWNELFYAQL